jgi:hypothetical protein
MRRVLVGDFLQGRAMDVLEHQQVVDGVGVLGLDDVRVGRKVHPVSQFPFEESPADFVVRILERLYGLVDELAVRKPLLADVDDAQITLVDREDDVVAADDLSDLMVAVSAHALP